MRVNACTIKKSRTRECKEKMNKFFHAIRKTTLAAIVLCLSFSSANLFAGGVYKWTDDSGTVHYSDKKPKDGNAESLKIKAGKTKGSRASAQAQINALNEKQTQKLAAQAQNLKEDTFKRENDARCQVLRNNLKKFAENSRIKINDDGNLRFLTPEEISEKKEQYEQTLNKHCS